MSKWWVFQRYISSRFGLWTLAPRPRAALFEYTAVAQVIINYSFEVFICYVVILRIMKYVRICSIYK